MEPVNDSSVVWKRLLGQREIFTEFVQQQITSETFLMKDAYLTCIENLDSVGWKKLVWGSYHVPKTSIIVWFAVLNRLPTSDRVF